jgi:pentatricopeptide repeat protein
MKGATELFELMETSPHANIRPDHVTYTTLMKGYAASGDMKGADHLFQRLRDHPDPDCRPNQVTYNTMLKGFVAEGDMDAADQLLEQMSSGVECRPDIVSMNTIIGGYARQGNLNRARHHLEQMRHHGIVPNPVTFHALIEGAIRHGEIDYADKLFQLAINHDNLALSAATYRIIIEAWLRAGDMQKAKFAFSHQTASNDEASLSSQALLTTSEDSQAWLMERTSSMCFRNSNRNRYSINSTYHSYAETNESEQCTLLRFPVKRESVGSVAGDDNVFKLISDQY